MARFPRVVATGTPHHVTQRGNAQRFVFDTDSDRLVYLHLLQRNCLDYHLSVLGFCLMSNHVHLVVIPKNAQSMAQVLRHTNGRYAAYLNNRQGATGHVWQGRFYSCPLDTNHLWSALRYTEMNPVRARLLADPVLYTWSSAAVHCNRNVRSLPVDLAPDPWRECWTATSWQEFLHGSATDQELSALRANTHTGRPLGTPEFVDSLEQMLHPKNR